MKRKHRLLVFFEKLDLSQQWSEAFNGPVFINRPHPTTHKTNATAIVRPLNS